MTTPPVAPPASHARPVQEGLLMRRLLCPIDLSETSAAALDSAAELARATGAEITALFVFPTVRAIGAEGGALPWPMIPDPGARSVVAKDVEEFVRGARQAGASVRARLEIGDPATEILAAADDMKADAIVIGTHGRSALERWVLGSVAQRVLRGARCPVLAVCSRRPHTPAVGPRPDGPILCALDLQEGSASTLRYALQLGRVTGRRVTVVHVIEDPWHYEEAALRAHVDWVGVRRQLVDDATDCLRGLLQAESTPGQPVDQLLGLGRPYRQILEFAAEQGASMIVMGRHGPGRPRGGLCGSNADHVMRAANCPVLTVRGA